MQVLIVKTSSMGDIIHALPAVTDAASAIPGIQFDWVIEESFIDVPLLHPAVKKVILIALRRWRKNPWQAITTGEVKRFYQQLRAKKYDLIIDAQASIKSAAVTRLARGIRSGMDAHSARESLSHWAYQEKYFVMRKQHAILRLRQLFAQALHYSYRDEEPNYGIDRKRLSSLQFTLPNAYIVFIPNASKETKTWPEHQWSKLIEEATRQGWKIMLPWGSDTEKQRAERLAATAANAQVLPKLSLTQMATVLANAKAAVCVDTGLSHLAAALDIPTITLYGPTVPGLVGTLGKHQIHLSANSSAERVWPELKKLIASTATFENCM